MGGLAVYRGLLSNGALVRLLSGEFISGIGNWLYLVALLVVVYQESSDPVLLGVVGAARVLPYVLLSVPAGIVADRYDRRFVLLVTDVARAGIMVVLAAIVFANGPVWAIVALAILATCFAPFFYPAIGAYIPSLVRDERELGPANSAATALDSIAFVIGPAVAGVLVAVADLGWAFALNAVSFGIVAVVLWFLPPSIGGRAAVPTETSAAAAGPAGPNELAGDDRAAGGTGQPSAAVTGGPELRAMLRPLVGLGLVDASTAVVLGGLSVLTVIIATEGLHAGESGTGYLNAAVGVGGFIGAVIAGALVLRSDLLRQLLLGAIAFGVGVAALGLAPSLGPALLAMVIASFGSLIIEVIGTTVFQRIVPDAVRGRAIGALATISRLAWAVGAFALPVLSAAVGLGVVLGASGAAIVVATLVGLALVGSTGRLMHTDERATLRRAMELPIFAGVPAPAIEVAAARLRAEPVAAGDVVIREGDPAESFYIIGTGRFGVDQLDPTTGAARHLRTLGPDEVFGELGLLGQAPRSATVTALTDGRLYVLDGPDFLELVGSAAGLSGRLIDLYRSASHS
jgi:MFS family permease